MRYEHWISNESSTVLLANDPQKSLVTIGEEFCCLIEADSIDEAIIKRNICEGWKRF